MSDMDEVYESYGLKGPVNSSFEPPSDTPESWVNRVVFGNSPMTLDEYQNQASTTFQYVNDMGMPMLVFTALGLNEEAGELAGKTKKYYRDNLDWDVARKAAAFELGDTLWYLSQNARLWGYSLEEVAKMNLDKLASRHARNVIHGSGDDR